MNQNYKSFLEKIEKEFDNTKFARGGGSSFECSDFEGMYCDQKLFLKAALKSQIEFLKVEIEKAKKNDKVCVYCHDTKWMKVSKMRGSGYDNRHCVWCRDGKDKLEEDQLVFLDDDYNAGISQSRTLLDEMIKEK